MRYKFRGKRKNGAEWIYGDLNHIDGKVYIFDRSDNAPLNSPDWFEVDPKSVGMSTGLNATKGKTQFIFEPVFEGDLFRHTREDETEGYLVVMWIPQRGAFYLVDVAHYEVLRDNDCSTDPEFEWLFRDADLYDFAIDCGLPKVGNVTDNPELINK